MDILILLAGRHFNDAHVEIALLQGFADLVPVNRLDMVVRDDGDLLRLCQFPDLFPDMREKPSFDFNLVRFFPEIHIHYCHGCPIPFFSGPLPKGRSVCCLHSFLRWHA